MKTLLTSDWRNFTDKPESRHIIASSPSFASSEHLWTSLFSRNCENSIYLSGLECCALRDFSLFPRVPSQSPLSPAEVSTLQTLHSSLRKRLPSSRLLKTAELRLAEEPAFSALLETALWEVFRKGIPAFIPSLGECWRESPTKVGKPRGFDVVVVVATEV